MRLPSLQAHRMTRARPTQVGLASPCPPQRLPRRRRQQEQVRCCSTGTHIVQGGVAGHLCSASMHSHVRAASLSLSDT